MITKADRLHIQKVATISAANPALIAVAVIIGWQFDLTALKSVLPG